MKYIFISLFFINFSVHATTSVDEEVNQLLLTKYYNSISVLSDLERKCSEKSDKILPRNLFKEIALNKQELRIILNFYHSKTILKCSQSALYSYLRNAVLLRLRVNTDEVERMIVASDQLITMRYLLYLESEIDYKKLKAKLKKQVSQLKRLQAPFDLILSSELLAKEIQK